jgi:RNA polymerase sigma-70 factor (ECF subfamily)
MDPVREFRKGSEAAFLRIFDEHHDALFRFACRLCGSNSDAEDIVHECFLELLRPDCAYDSRRTALRTYLFGVVRNQCLKRWRRNRSAEALHSMAADGTTPESEFLRSEVTQAVAEAVGRLPDTQREILILAHYEQMSLAEIAEVVELEVTAVKSRLQRARAQLKETLAAYVGGKHV